MTRKVIPFRPRRTPAKKPTSSAAGFLALSLNLTARVIYARRRLAHFAHSAEHVAMSEALAAAIEIVDAASSDIPLAPSDALIIEHALAEFQLLCESAVARRFDEKHVAPRRAGGSSAKRKERAVKILALYREKQKAQVPQHEIAGDVAKAFDVTQTYVRSIVRKDDETKRS